MFGFFKKSENEVAKKGNISLWSYKRFCMFYNYVVYSDDNFEENMDGIIKCVTEKYMTSIPTIAAYVGLETRDCIFRLRYLKNKRWLDQDYYINQHTQEIKKCSENDIKLMDKYYDAVYLKHLSIDEMGKKCVADDLSLDLAQVKKDIFQEIKYLYIISLLSGIKLDEEEQEIIYYSLEKKKKNTLFVTISCPSCGALVDVPRNFQEKCNYCGTVVNDTYSKRGEE